MIEFKCPGQDGRNLKAELITCSKCGYALEIFSDEAKAICPKCGNLVCRERLPSCIDWCKYAKDCVGEEKLRKKKGE
ncbi:MAG: phosphohydrolase [Candidatus Omnitrophica bacterium]|nr:phosphohydrolase [Candidatus Omnitrophota bacterium]MCM8771036.1 phosphohydrolase [Candidatus Omnitrophota bacterium]